MMISPEEATRIVLSNLFEPPEELVNVHSALNQVLNEDVIADTDFPPFHRVMMDGVALAFADWEKGVRSFKVIGLQKAGSVPLILQGQGNCIEVMTGAICPNNADVIIPYEDLHLENGSCQIKLTNVRLRQNIHLSGSDKKVGEILLEKGKFIGAAEIGVAVSVGKSTLSVLSKPKIHLFSTGDELVETDIIPLPYQIRRSNVYALQQILKNCSMDATQSHLPDEYDIIKSEIEYALNRADVIMLTGGVSKGKFDLIPQVLEELGVEKLFHRIAQKPGKPMWFGRKNGITVFAFPGNPVSTFMCAMRYMIPWLRKSMSQPPFSNIFAKLGTPFENKTSLAYFLQVKISFNENGEIIAEPITGKGSGDFANLSEADGFMELPAGPAHFPQGSAYPLHLYRNVF